MSAQDNMNGRQFFFHGTSHVLKPGSQVETGHKGHKVSSSEHNYFGSSEHVARTFGGLAATRDRRKTYHIYEVEPTGDYEPDPDGPGGMGGYRSRSPLTVGREVERGSAPGEAQAWYKNFATGKGYPKGGPK